jgi:4-hydroxy-tetrahydrodipicolinate reductase
MKEQGIMAKFAVLGFRGRMGQALASAIAEAGHEFCVGVDLGGDPMPVIGQCEVAVDFSAPDGLAAHCAAARRAGIPILIGTTGLAEEHFAAIAETAKVVPVLQTGNTSLGVTLLAALVREAAMRLGPDWDIEVLEMHHRHKVDAPSGTAKLLGEAAATGRGIALADHREAGRDGHTGERAAGAIGFAVLRGGTVTGEHSVIFAGEEERITLAHSAENRMIFARGAVRGAAWLIGRAPGRYTMEDVLGLGS